MGDAPQARIRPLEPADAPALARIHVRSWQVAYRGQVPDDYLDHLTDEIPRRAERWEGFIREAPGLHRTLLAAEEDGRVIGFVNYGPPDDAASLGPHVGELYAIYLDPDAFGKGHGRTLMDAAVKGLTEAGFTEAVLWVLGTNQRARRFYEIAGWHADGGTKTEHRGEVELREVRYRRDLSRVKRA
ncbi:MAG TPA: GNAT family N-acetyltransferase [Candidatus Limnocylindria bacterium]|jgi:ribosomal protein S18 acetylase RimI-like enzyme|nr:GNAT family N-acetyltransferase [Candidatus Limnocylindria bacterium]